MWITMQVLVVAIVVALILIVASAFAFNHYLVELFDVSMFTYIAENLGKFVTIALVEIVGLFMISLVVSYLYVSSLNKKI